MNCNSFFKAQKPNKVIFVLLIKASENTTVKKRGTSQKDKENQPKAHLRCLDLRDIP